MANPLASKACDAGSSPAAPAKSRRKPTKHGTISGYINHNCRCDACKLSWRHYQLAKKDQWAGDACRRCHAGKPVKDSPHCRACRKYFRDYGRQRTVEALSQPFLGTPLKFT